MRRIHLTKETREILQLVIQNSPNVPISIDSMRARVALKEQLDGLADVDEFLVEEADHKLIVDSINNFPWAKANKDLLRELEGIINAESFSPSSLKSKAKS